MNAGVNLAAGLFAEKLGLKSDNSLVQTAVFVVTKAAILEGAQLIGIGGGLAKGDLAKIMKKEEVIWRCSLNIFVIVIVFVVFFLLFIMYGIH